jgi:hypothetical protein
LRDGDAVEATPPAETKAPAAAAASVTAAKET